MREPAKQPQKFQPVPVKRRTCSAEELYHHLEAFVRAFIEAPRRHRCRHVLLERPEKARLEMHNFERYLDDRYCTLLDSSASFPHALAVRFGDNVGVYFDCNGKSWTVTASEAATVAESDYTDAILSLDPGRTVLYFHHDTGTYLCRRQMPA